MLIAAMSSVSSHGVESVNPYTTALFTGLLVLMILCLALEEKLHAKKSLIVGLFATGALLIGGILGILPFGPVMLPNGHAIEMPIYISAIDWGVITIIVGSSLFIEVTSKSGLFSWIAIRLTKASAGNPVRLLWYYGVMTVVFSAVLNNVTAMIIVGSLTSVSLTKLEKNDLLLGFLLVEGLLTNIGGLLTLISSVPNIIVGNAAGISFVSFFMTSAPYVVIATVLTIFLGTKLFKIKPLLSESEQQKAAELVNTFDENDGIESMVFFRFSTFMLLAFILIIATTSMLPVVSELGMGFVALAFAVLILVRYKSEVDQFYKSIDWDLIIFFMALFVFIVVIEHAQVLQLIGHGIQFVIGNDESSYGVAMLLFVSSVFSSVTDNIPLAAMLSKVLASAATTPDSSLWWSVIFGANLGGNLTPIGSASTLVAVTIIHRAGIKLSFAGFVKQALPFAICHILLAIGYVLVLSLF
ncbi:MAG: SLC13 family permease [Reinekea sp.]